jgi:hypothetical protein
MINASSTHLLETRHAFVTVEGMRLQFLDDSTISRARVRERDVLAMESETSAPLLRTG